VAGSGSPADGAASAAAEEQAKAASTEAAVPAGSPGARAGDAIAHRDYRCLECGDTFSRDGLPAGVPAPCPVCGSGRTREHWESRVRNAGKVSGERFEDLRDRPG
jgi:hypothetical protein